MSNNNEDGERYNEDYDNTYINIELYNKAQVNAVNYPVRCETNIQQASNILENASNYKMAIERFTVPGNIPMFIYPDNGNDLYRVEIYNTTSNLYSIKNLNYNPVNTFRQFENKLYPRGFYSYIEFLNLVNSAILSAHNELKANDNTYTSSYAPYLRYEASSQLFSLTFPIVWLNNTNWQLRFSYNLYISYFPSFASKDNDTVVPTHLPVEIYMNSLLGNEKPNDNTSYIIYTESPCVACWQQLQKILFTTNTIPVNSEIISSSDNRTRSVLLDFEPTPDNQSTIPFQYFASTYRWVDLISYNPLNNIQLAVLIQYKDGDVYPLYIAPNEGFTVKMIIRGKNSHLTN